MIEEIVKLFDDIIDHEASWSKAIRKTFFIVLFSALIYGGYSTIKNNNEGSSVSNEDRDKKEIVIFNICGHEILKSLGINIDNGLL